MKMTKKDCDSKHGINIESYPTIAKKKHKYEQIDIKTCLKKNTKKTIVKKNNQHKKLYSFFLYNV